MKRIFASLVLVGLLSTTALGVAAVDTTQVVNENEIARQAEGTTPTNNWVLYTRNAGTGTFITGPATPPLGNGSLEFSTPTGSDKAWLFNYDHVGTELDAITAIGYSTYRTSGSGSQVTSINIEVDYNGPAEGGYAVLVFEPVYNTSQGVVTNDVWQTWDAYNGGEARWWSSRAIPGVCAFSCFVTWDTILANNPDAVILGGFGVNQGSGNPTLVAATDALTLGMNGDTVTYDFEPVIGPPTDKEQCKNGGWQEFNNPTFENQGLCIKYVNTGS